MVSFCFFGYVGVVFYFFFCFRGRFYIADGGFRIVSFCFFWENVL